MNKEELKILLKKMTGYNSQKTRYEIFPLIKILQNVLKETDKILLVEMNSTINFKRCTFILLEDRILYITGITSNELFLKNIASYEKNQTGCLANIKISDAGNKTFEFRNFNIKNAQLVIDFLQNNIDINKIIEENNNLPLFIQDYKKTVYKCMFGGFLGLHRLYTGYSGIALLQVLLLIFYTPVFVLWWLIDSLALIKNKFKTIDEFELSNFDENLKKLIISPIILSIMFLGLKALTPAPTILHKPGCFTIKEINKTIQNINKTTNNFDPKTNLYIDSVYSKNNYKLGIFHNSYKQEGYSKYALIADCENKTVIPFWNGLYKNNGDFIQLLNYLEENEIKEENYNINKNIENMWVILCSNK